MLFVVGQRGQAVHQFAAIGCPYHGAVPSHTSQADQGGRDFCRRIVVRRDPVEVAEDRPRVLRDQRFVMRRKQHRHTAVGQRLGQHHATSGSETMTWALVPAIPNADVAATRCPLTAGHGVRVLARRKPCFSQLISGLASAACKVGGIAQCSGGHQNLGQTQCATGSQGVA